METLVSMNSNDIRKQLAQQVLALSKAQVGESPLEANGNAIFSEFKEIKVEEVLQLEGLEFVAACYYLALNRSPDLVGFQYLSKRYLDSPSKEFFLLELILSPEGQTQKKHNDSARSFIETRIVLRNQEEQRKNTGRIKKKVSLFLDLLKFPFQFEFNARRVFVRLDSNSLKLKTIEEQLKTLEGHQLRLEATAQKIELQNRMIFAELVRLNDLLGGKNDF